MGVGVKVLTAGVLRYAAGGKKKTMSAEKVVDVEEKDTPVKIVLSDDAVKKAEKMTGD